MNLIANNCVGARIYERSGVQFNNPFTWCIINFNDYINLIKNFNNINFYNIKVSLELYKNHSKKSIICELEHNIKLHYIHYVYDNCSTHKNENGVDVYSKTIIKYFTDLYYRRLDRMDTLKEQPTFILVMREYVNKFDPNYMNYIDEFLKFNNENFYIFAHKDNVKNIKTKSKTHILGFDDETFNLTGTLFCEKCKNMFFN